MISVHQPVTSAPKSTGRPGAATTLSIFRWGSRARSIFVKFARWLWVACPYSWLRVPARIAGDCINRKPLQRPSGVTLTPKGSPLEIPSSDRTAAGSAARTGACSAFEASRHCAGASTTSCPPETALALTR